MAYLKWSEVMRVCSWVLRILWDSAKNMALPTTLWAQWWGQTKSIDSKVGLDFQEKTLWPIGLYIFRFSCQHKYLSEKHGKLVTSEKNRYHQLVNPVVAMYSSVKHLRSKDANNQLALLGNRATLLEGINLSPVQFLTGRCPKNKLPSLYGYM